jgi:hypothetical protein
MRLDGAGDDSQFCWCFGCMPPWRGSAAPARLMLQIQGFGTLPGIAIVVICLTINQMAYLAGVFRRPSGLFQKQANKVPSRRRNNDVAGKPHQQQKAPSSFT